MVRSAAPRHPDKEVSLAILPNCWSYAEVLIGTFTFYIKCAKASATEIANFFDSTSRRRSSTPRLTPQPSRSRLVVDTLMPAIPGSPAESKFDILLVEDNLINQKVLSKQLRRSGCTVHVANQGVEALDFIKTSRYWRDNGGNGHEISFILLDVVSPSHDQEMRTSVDAKTFCRRCP